MSAKLIKTDSGVLYSLDSLNKTLEYNNKIYRLNFAVGLAPHILRRPTSLKKLHRMATSMLHSETALNSSIQPGCRVYFDCGSDIFLSSIVDSVYAKDNFESFKEISTNIVSTLKLKD